MYSYFHLDQFSINLHNSGFFTQISSFQGPFISLSREGPRPIRASNRPSLNRSTGPSIHPIHPPFLNLSTRPSPIHLFHHSEPRIPASPSPPPPPPARPPLSVGTFGAFSGRLCLAVVSLSSSVSLIFLLSSPPWRSIISGGVRLRGLEASRAWD